jgi:hypothetical protein
METYTPKAPADSHLRALGSHANSAVCKLLNAQVRALAHVKAQNKSQRSWDIAAPIIS